MFRYEAQAFTQSAEYLKDVCRELRECEEGLRMLDRQWKRDPDQPAPRARLSKSLSNMEQRETSLTLLERKMTSISRLYEIAEQRAEDLAEETAAGREREDSRAAAGEESEKETKMLTGYISWGGYAIPLRPLRPFRPFPWIIRPYRPFLLFPPRRPRPIQRWILIYLFHKLFPTDRWLRHLVEVHPIVNPRIIRPLMPLEMRKKNLLVQERQQRRIRLDGLFRERQIRAE